MKKILLVLSIWFSCFQIGNSQCGPVGDECNNIIMEFWGELVQFNGHCYLKLLTHIENCICCEHTWIVNGEEYSDCEPLYIVPLSPSGVTEINVTLIVDHQELNQTYYINNDCTFVGEEPDDCQFEIVVDDCFGAAENLCLGCWELVGPGVNPNCNEWFVEITPKWGPITHYYFEDVTEISIGLPPYADVQICVAMCNMNCDEPQTPTCRNWPMACGGGIKIPEEEPKFLENLGDKVFENQTSSANLEFIFPNPVSDYFSISTEQQPEKIEIISITGKKLKEFSNASENKFNIEDLPTGTYFVRVKFAEGQSKTEKIIKH